MNHLTVAIPVRDRWELTEGLLSDLGRESIVDRIDVYDNGSTDATAAELASWPDVRVRRVEAQGQGIYEMWNRALRGEGYVAILNNDARLAWGTLRILADALDADPTLAVVSPPHGPHRPTELTYVGRISNDERIGLAGFAFMARASLFGSAIPLIDEGYRWWFGDDELVAATTTSGYRVGVTADGYAHHIGGGSQTVALRDDLYVEDTPHPDGRRRRAITPAFADALAADGRRFRSRWESSAAAAARRP